MTIWPMMRRTFFAPFQGSYGFLPASRWPEFNVSRIWTATTDRGSRVVTWEGAFTVDLIAHITPEGVTDDDVTCQWSLDPYDVEGYFEDADSLITHFPPTSGGGVYSFTFTCGSLSNSEVAKGLSLFEAISNLVYSTWGPDEKVIRIWPNSLKPTNYATPSLFGDPDFQFTSPGFLFLPDP